MVNIKLTKAKTLELDPAKSYLIQVDSNTLPTEDIYTLRNTLKKWGIKNVVVVVLPAGRSLKVTEFKKEK